MPNAILDQFGRPARRKAAFGYASQRLIDASQPSGNLPFWRTNYAGIDREVTVHEWRTVVSASKKLYANLGPAKGAIADKATYSVGRAWKPEFQGNDKTWGAQATEWLVEQWYPIADVRGAGFDFTTDLFVASVSIDRDGDIFLMLTESENGWPSVQLIPGHRIGSRNTAGTVDFGPYAGLKEYNGVITNRAGRAVAYRLLGDDMTGADDTFLSARNVMHLFEPEWYDQSRGFPGFTHALNDLRALLTTQGYEEKAAMLASEIGLIEENPMGLPDLNDPAFELTASDSTFTRPTTGLIARTLEGGSYRYFQANTGSKITTVKNDRPGQSWESFMDRLVRNACVGFGWPFEMAWDVSKLGGANTRLIVAKAQRAVEDRQDLLRPCARRAVGFAVAKAIKLGILQPNEDWWRWSFSTPPRITVDAGYDSKFSGEEIKDGRQTLTDYLADRGIKLADHIAKIKAEREMLAAAGISATQAPIEPQPAKPGDDDEEDEDEKTGLE